MNKKLEKMKEEYMQISASEALIERVENTMRSNAKISRSIGYKIAGFAACLVIVFVLLLNFNSTFATAVADIPGMNVFVKVLTFGKYVVNDGGYQADIKIPKIEGLLDKQLEDKINSDFKDNADAVILAFENEMKELKKQFPNEEVHFGIDSGYMIKTDNDSILAIDVYIVNTVGSSSTTHKFYTINKKSKTLLTLSSLFKEGADYVETLSEYLKAEMKSQNEKGGETYWLDSFTGIKENQNFYVDKDGSIVICFDKYEIGPGSSGSPEFVIPNEVVRDILK